MATRERLVIENMFRIIDKDSNDVPFILNDSQRKVDNKLTGRDVIPKARQKGVSSYFLARSLVKCLGHRNEQAVVISHDDEGTKRMLKKVHFMIDHMQGAKPVIGVSSVGEIQFKKTNSVIYVGTAGSRAFGRGDTINTLHCSEVALWKNPKSLLGGLFQAVPRNGDISLESTGHGTGNYFQRLCMRAASGNSRYRLHFLPWHDDNEYIVPLSDSERMVLADNLKDEWDEPALLKRGFSLEQLAFRREKLEELDFDLALFKQEYPETLDECFQATGFGIFNLIDYEPTDAWQNAGNHLYILKDHPRENYQYALGGDVSAGVGRDYSVAEIFCLNTQEQVGEYRNNRIDPKQFGHKVKELGLMFNDAYVTIENNNHGILTVSELMDIYPRQLLHRKSISRVKRDTIDKISDIGIRTNVKTKPFAIGQLRSLLSSRWLIHSPVLKGELDTFIEHENGSLSAEEGCFDDTVMASAMFAMTTDLAITRTMPKKHIPRRLTKDPFTLDSIIDEMKDKGSTGLISLQV